jgi:hypothetical protein
MPPPAPLETYIGAWGWRLMQTGILPPPSPPPAVVAPPAGAGTGTGTARLIENMGLGPAMIRWFSMSVNGKSVTNWTDFSKAMTLPPDAKYTFTLPRPGSVYTAGISGILFHLPKGAAADQLRANHGRQLFELCYCSIYEECWRVRSIVEDIQRAACDEEKPIVTARPIE